MTGSSAINWLFDNSNECSDGTRVFHGKTIPSRMYTEVAEYVRNLDTEMKEVQPTYFNWVEGGWWFEFRPAKANRNSRARYENGRVEVHFECGEYTD